jgi:hypothetical protein
MEVEMQWDHPERGWYLVEGKASVVLDGSLWDTEVYLSDTESTFLGRYRSATAARAACEDFWREREEIQKVLREVAQEQGWFNATNR